MTGRRDGPPARAARPSPSHAALRRGSGRRSRPVRRSSAGLTPVRAGALLALLAGLAGIYGLTVSSAFAARRTVVSGLAWTPQQRILDALALPAGQNLFTLSAGDLEARLASVSAVRSARVTVALPDEVRVAVSEREALVRWQVGARQFLVDGSGLLFADLGGDPPAAASALPLIADARAASRGLGVGSTLDPVTLDAALRLGSLTPADLGSGATGLALSVDDSDGFTVASVPAGWDAVFGFYTPTLRTTDLIPGQVRLLRSLLYGREARVGRVILADDRSGTYLPRATPQPSATPAATPKPTTRPTAKPTTRPTARPTPTPTPRPSPTPRP